MNPLLWCINVVYIKKRWAELGGTDVAAQLPQVTACEEPGCPATATKTGFIMGRVSYRCAAGHQFTRVG